MGSTLRYNEGQLNVAPTLLLAVGGMRHSEVSAMSTPDSTTLVKRCTKCGKELPVTQFNKHKRTKDGLSCWCKECNKYDPEYYRRNRTHILERQRIKKEQDPLHKKEIDRRYYIRNREKIIGRVHSYRDTHPELRKMYKAKRRTDLRNLPNDFTRENWSNCLEYFNHRCAICGKPQGLWHKLVADHWIPLSSPNCPGTVTTNIVPLCHAIKDGQGGCNVEKRDNNPLEWLICKFGSRKAKKKLAEIQAYFDSVRDKEEINK